MKSVELTKTMQLPEGKEELASEPILDKHERWLRLLILNNFTPIYLLDGVRVSERWAGDSKNPHAGKKGIVVDIEMGIQSALNIDYLIYTINTQKGEEFETYYYTLDQTRQVSGNQLLEKLLKETNSALDAIYKK